ncbi:MAG: glutamate--cysteine ligase [Frankia sp.]
MRDRERASVGVEEEFHVLDLESRQLVPRAEEILDQLPDDRFSAELQRSVVETNSHPSTSLLELRADLIDLRRQLAAVANPLGLGIGAVGTVPLTDMEAMEVSRDPRYLAMLDEYQLVARDQLICGAQVHVDVHDRDLAMAVVAWVAPWLPMLLAMSASSPFWFGADTGYASYRTLVWQRWPTAGVAGSFHTAAEYDHLIADLIKSGTISDPGMVYFDVRPSAHLPTVELRICDGCPNVDDVVLIAGLFRALVTRAIGAIEAGEAPPPPRTELLRAATWRAARSGLEGELVDLTGPAPVPARVLLARLLSDVRVELEEAGDWELVQALADAAVGRGSAAARQRRAFARRRSLADVVDLVLAETIEAPPLVAVAGVGTAEALADRPALLDGYEPPAFDEAVDAGGTVRPPYRAMIRALDRLGPAVLDERERARDAEQLNRGVLFKVNGTAEAGPFPYDLVPRLVDASDWADLKVGLAQRVRALEAFLRDTYGPREAVTDGVIPAFTVTESPGYRDAGARVGPDAVRATVSGVDLVRDRTGRWLVLEDNLRVPSGIGYALEGRRLTATVLPELSPPAGLVPVDNAPALLYAALVASAPEHAPTEPAVAVLSDGEDNSAHFEHRLLADEMGVPLIGPADLIVVDGTVRIMAGGRRIDVLYRRIDEDELLAATGADGAPLGPGLLAAVHAGRLTLANAPGNGVADDKGVYPYIRRLIPYYLGEQPLLDDVPTYLCGEPESLELVLDRIGELVVKPVDGYGGEGVMIGPHADAGQIAHTREQVRADPKGWIAQEMISLSTHPTWLDGRMQPCAVDLRAFVYAGDGVRVAPAALTRVAPIGSLIVNSSQGGGSKDTWILR